MGPTWVLSAPDGPHVGPMNLAIWVDIPGKTWIWNVAVTVVTPTQPLCHVKPLDLSWVLTSVYEVYDLQLQSPSFYLCSKNTPLAYLERPSCHRTYVFLCHFSIFWIKLFKFLCIDMFRYIITRICRVNTPSYRPFHTKHGGLCSTDVVLTHSDKLYLCSFLHQPWLNTQCIRSHICRHITASTG